MFNTFEFLKPSFILHLVADHFYIKLRSENNYIPLDIQNTKLMKLT